MTELSGRVFGGTDPHSVLASRSKLQDDRHKMLEQISGSRLPRTGSDAHDHAETEGRAELQK